MNMRNSKNVLNYLFGPGTIQKLGGLVDPRRKDPSDHAVFFVDEFFRDRPEVAALPRTAADELMFVETAEEPKTSYVNFIISSLKHKRNHAPCAIVGMGGGTTLDTAKAVANLYTNEGRAEDYQGWDLVRNPAVYKIAVPTLSGTGAEASRTCVMTNAETGLKLGMNSDHTIYDQLVLDPDLTRTVPRHQYFYSGMDTYVHCIESLSGSYRNAVGDAYSRQALTLCREVFSGSDMKNDEGREKLMVASYLGGCAIANSFVGVVHPFSAGLSVVLGIHHGLANCIALANLGEFYPQESAELRRMAGIQSVEIPTGVCGKLDAAGLERLYESTIVHEKPLANALGVGFRSILTKDRVMSLFAKM